MSPTACLDERLARALRLGGHTLDPLAEAEPVDRRDALLTLLRIHDLHLAPVQRVGPAARWQHHPAVAALKTRLESDLIDALDAEPDGEIGDHDLTSTAGAVAAMRTIARRDLVPPVYGWAAGAAAWDDLVAFLAVEGGPDGGFDDLVAACQLGLGGEAKLELARNYWDEMGNGDLDKVHTELHHHLVAALDMPTIARAGQPTEALERSALGGLLATNRWLQPEMVGALGLIELQAGPRCRKVVTALTRLDAPAGAFPFYTEHADVDPRHGKDWLDNAVVPLVEADPEWGPRIVRGAQWRSIVNRRFFAAMADRFCGDDTRTSLQQAS
jgi:hypothetical protein